MYILAIETSTLTGGVAISKNEEIIGEHILSIDTKYSERLMITIDNLLKACKLTIHDIDAIAVSMGPGSFTGLRIGVGTAKGLAYGTNKPFIAVPTLDAMAVNMIPSRYQICPMLDARQKEVYTCLYSPDGEKLKDHAVVSPEKWLDELAVQKTETIFLGSGADAYKKLIDQKLGDYAYYAPFHKNQALPASVAYLAVKMYQNKDFSDYTELEPLYLRGASAKVKRAMFNI